MPALRLRSVSGPLRGREFVFSGPRVRIGRSRDNDLILPDEEAPAASGHHAEAVRDESGAWSIVDVGSTNGTRLNDVVVKRQQLENGDRITMGGNQFVVALRPPVRWGTVAAALLSLAAIAAIVVSVMTARVQPRATFEDIAASAAHSVCLITLEHSGSRSIVGTAFAVADGGWLATNAHIANAIRDAALAGRDDRRALAIQGDLYGAHRIVGVRIHKGWHEGSLRNDVALLQLESAARLAPLRLADAAAFGALRRGSPVAAFGFPAVSTDPMRPRGRLSVDVVGDVRGEFLEVGLGIAPGTSGSPVFDRSGAVTAIVVGGDFVTAPGSAERPSGTAANWALSVAPLKDLLAQRD